MEYCARNCMYEADWWGPILYNPLHRLPATNSDRKRLSTAVSSEGSRYRPLGQTWRTRWLRLRPRGVCDVCVSKAKKNKESQTLTVPFHVGVFDADDDVSSAACTQRIRTLTMVAEETGSGFSMERINTLLRGDIACNLCFPVYFLLCLLNPWYLDLLPCAFLRRALNRLGGSPQALPV